MAGTDSSLFLALIISLICSSFTVAWVVNDYAQAPVCDFGQACAPITLGLIDTDQDYSLLIESYQDYTNASGYNKNLTYTIETWVNTFGIWTQSAAGYELTGIGGVLGTGLLASDPVLLMDNIRPVDGVYTVDYLVDNTPNTEFFITPVRDRLVGRSQYDIRIEFSPSSIKIPSYFGGIGEVSYYYTDYSITNSQATAPGGSLYRTVYDTNEKTITVYKDGSLLFTAPDMPIPLSVGSVNFADNYYYGGVGSNTVGFKILETTTTRSIGDTPDPKKATGISLKKISDGIINAIDGVIPGAGAVIQMLEIIAQVVFWTLPETIFPLWLNMILIKTQVLTLIYLGAKLARGN